VSLFFWGDVVVAFIAFDSSSSMVSSEDLNWIEIKSSESIFVLRLTMDTSFVFGSFCTLIVYYLCLTDNNNKYIVWILYIL